MTSDKLGDILVADGKLSESQLSHAVENHKQSGKLLGEVLLELNYVTSKDIALALSHQLDIPYFELGEDFRLEPEEVRLIPKTIASRFCLLPLKREKGHTLTVIMRDPLDLQALDTVRSLTNLEVHKAVSTEERITTVIEKFYRKEAHIESDLRDLVDLETGQIEEIREDEIGESAVDSDQLLVLANDAPVVRFVNLLLMQAVRDRASDIHFEPREKTVSIRLRVDGRLREVTPPPKSIYQAIVTRIKILSEMDIAERRLPLDGRMKFKYQDRVIDVRVSSLPEIHGEKMVLRILDRASLVVDMEDIGFEGEMLKRFQRTLKLPNGIVLLTGPTGSGKTTTLYSALNYLKSPEVNIQTVEDPVEYQIDGINQMPTKDKIGLTFAKALRSILRQDPDVILIGEMRDLETAEIAMQASLTGHLVLSTLHTNDATTAFSRLHDIGVLPYLTAATLKLVIAQRLVRKICPHCKEACQPAHDHLDVFLAAYPEAKKWTFYRGAGCEKCGHRGYLGRRAIFEFLEVNDTIRQMVMENAGDVALRRHATKNGMETLSQYGARMVERGITTIDEVMAVCPVGESQ
ncbi:MAG: GspE/PulE family protein [Verrucomicrobia bacterium]|nr:GspE/PulE family protein [Verrucomicrobiota bacterium]